MGLYKGPCDRCGKYLEKRVNPGRRRYHIECANEVAAEHNIAMAMGTNPQLAVSARVGAETAAQIKRREGKVFTRWAGGMSRYLDTLDTTE